MATVAKKNDLKSMGILNLVERIVDETCRACQFYPTPAKRFIKELAKRLGLTELQAVMLAVFIDQCDDSRIRYRDIAHHFDVRTVNILAVSEVFNEMNKLGLIRRRHESDGDTSFRIPPSVIEGLKKGEMPEPECIEGLTAQEFIDVIDEWLKQRKEDEIVDEELDERLKEIIQKNQHLHIAQVLKGLGFKYEDLMLFLVISNLYIMNHDDQVMRHDIDDYFPRRVFRSHAECLELGEHILMQARLVEHSCIEGKADPKSWKLTNYCKNEVLAELNLKTEVNVRANLTHYEDIQEKTLFYNENVTKQVKQLASLLDAKRMDDVLKRMADKGMRKGFVCLFYGGPGTGKTETVQQLARMTKRDIMLVDVPSIRSKWVGETEQNIKALFDRYRHAVKSSKQAPILLFNEADALLNKRFEGGVNAVDKMENTMQNIILQEMETLEGVMIATTNLTGNLDAAFERRFLYKIEFEKPTPKERKHIWKAMLADLTDEQALNLAERFDFSGGQIENIARKRVISDILEGRDTLDLDSIIESCKNEFIMNKQSGKRIGF